MSTEPTETKPEQTETNPEQTETPEVDLEVDLHKYEAPKGLYERVLGNKPWPVRYFVNTVSVLALLWLFLLGLKLMGDAFKGIFGTGVGKLLSDVLNPMAGLALGVLCTVLLQSSSTTTSIIVTMVAAELLTVTKAIPLVMGANIGTSVTNTIVAHGHITVTEEFTRGLAGATVHDAFNILTVMVLLPIEIITQGISQAAGGDSGFLGIVAGAIADGLIGKDAFKFPKILDPLVKPVSSEFIKVNKDRIKALAKGCEHCLMKGGVATIVEEVTGDCVKHNKEGDDTCFTQDEWNEKWLDSQTLSGGFAKDMGDVGGSILVLVLSLVFLCLALYGIVRLLHYLVLTSGRLATETGEETCFLVIIRKVLKSGYASVSMLVGAVLTIAVQSSSIITSTFTPLVALDIMSVEDMLPVTLGANIGTTCTAFTAAIVTGSKASIQISLCHLLFNVIGILIWYPIPKMRAISINMARTIAGHAAKFKLFGTIYILTAFIVIPLVLFGFSFSINLGAGGVVLNIFLSLVTVIAAILFVKKFDVVARKLGMKQFELGPETEQKPEAAPGAVPEGEASEVIQV
jgi:sodium-dependent phosphate cotransporter